VTIEKRTAATTASPPREMPVVIVKPAELLASVLHEGADVLLSRGNSVVQLKVERSMGGPHCCQIFHTSVRVRSLPKEEGIHLLLSSRVDVELLKLKVDLANVYCFIGAGVRENQLEGLSGREVVETPPLKMLTGEGARLGSLVEQVM
jgi:hypothetical protein